MKQQRTQKRGARNSERGVREVPRSALRAPHSSDPCTLISDSWLVPDRPFRQRIGRKLRAKNRLAAQPTATAVDQQGKLPLSFLLAAGKQLPLAIFKRSGKRRLQPHAPHRPGQRSLLKLHFEQVPQM